MMTTLKLTNDQLAKLPQYARRYIHDLESQINRLKRDREEMLGNGKSNTLLTLFPDAAQPLPNDAKIRFCLGDNDMDNIIDVRIVDGKLDVSTMPQMFTQHLAANHCYIHVLREWGES
jgi:hypothetical protein